MMSTKNTEKPSLVRKAVNGYFSTITGYGLAKTSAKNLSSIVETYSDLYRRFSSSKAARSPEPSSDTKAKYVVRYRNARITAFVSMAFSFYCLYVFLVSIGNPAKDIWSIACFTTAMATYLISVKDMHAFRLSKKNSRITIPTWTEYAKAVKQNPLNSLPISQNKNNNEGA